MKRCPFTSATLVLSSVRKVNTPRPLGEIKVTFAPVSGLGLELGAACFTGTEAVLGAGLGAVLAAGDSVGSAVASGVVVGLGEPVASGFWLAAGDSVGSVLAPGVVVGEGAEVSSGPAVGAGVGVGEVSFSTILAVKTFWSPARLTKIGSVVSLPAAKPTGRFRVRVMGSLTVRGWLLMTTAFWLAPEVSMASTVVVFLVTTMSAVAVTSITSFFSSPVVVYSVTSTFMRGTMTTRVFSAVASLMPVSLFNSVTALSMSTEPAAVSGRSLSSTSSFMVPLASSRLSAASVTLSTSAWGTPLPTSTEGLAGVTGATVFFTSTVSSHSLIEPAGASALLVLLPAEAEHR